MRKMKPAVYAAPGSSLRHELVRYATLAASSHNTQCWKFRLKERAISILPDLSRRCPVVDPDDHHLFASLGCAVENLIQAALANGLRGEARFEAAGEGAVRITLEPTRTVVSPLFEAIPRRQCTRAEFDGKPLSNEELKAWIRFGGDEAVRTGERLFSRSTGNPSMPGWLGSRLFSLLFTARRENEKYAAQIRSSAGIAIFISEASDKAYWRRCPARCGVRCKRCW